MDKIILMGYMGAGKSTVGQLLAAKLGVSFIDLDLEIESDTNLSVNEIFKTKGELYFRKIEHRLLCEILERPQKFVLSLGGGTPCYSGNDKLIDRDDTVSVYLKTSIKTLAERLEKNIETRPLLSDGQDLTEFIAKHLFDRSYYYYQAKHIIATDNKSAKMITDEIAALLT